FAKVAFVFGALQHKLNPDKLSVTWDDIVVEVENIVSDWYAEKEVRTLNGESISWGNVVEVENILSDGYTEKDVRTFNGELVSIMSYAQRVILEKFCN
ncbi:hypothetical protein, partial [Bacillus thuringiensis]